MTSSRAKPAAFDTHVDSYDVDCMQGLSLSGESRDYFARGRLDFLQAWWRETERAEPRFIVDYGCGTGEVTALLADRFRTAEVVGVDPSGECVERAASRHASARVRFGQLGSDMALQPADLVHVNGVVHHVEPAERVALLADMARRLGPCGALALFENNPLNPGTRLVMSRIPFDRDAVPVPPWEARDRVRGAGLAIARHRYLFYFPRPLRALRGLEPWLARLPLGAQYGILATRG